MNWQIVTSLLSGIVGGLLAVWAALVAVRRSEFYRLAGHLKMALRNCVRQMESSGSHPVSIVENETVDNLVSDIMPIFPVLRRQAFNKAWNDYRYDKTYDKPYSPTAYTTAGTIDTKRLIESRINTIISCLN